MIITETHLTGQQKIHINNEYECIPHNRPCRHIRAKRNYGGLCVIFRKHLYLLYHIEVVDKTVDGIMAIKFTHKQSEYCFLLIATYLAPERSLWGRDAEGFYGHILHLIFEYNDCDTVYVSGDLNSRCGAETDFIPGVDSLEKRIILDKSKNKHGISLLNFLLDTKLCICNGRVTPEYDNFTCIEPAKGSSVVDYFLVPIDMINNCIELRVNTARNMIQKYCNLEESQFDRINIPDHSVLTMKIKIDQLHCDNDIDVNVLGDNTHYDMSNDNMNFDHKHIYFNRYNMNANLNCFLDSEVARESLLSMINDIEHARNIQEDIDDIYDRFCKMYHDEMNVWFRHYNVHPSSRKRI